MAGEKYTVVMSDETMKNVSAYKTLLSTKYEPGAFLSKVLDSKNVSQMTDAVFLKAVLNTKKPQFFANRIKGSGLDWNNSELSILGDVSIAVPVNIYDNMAWSLKDIVVYQKPFAGELLYTPGCLLKKGLPDFMEIVDSDQTINQEKYTNLVVRRLFPVFKYANEHSSSEQKAIINVPGLGCGKFAGKFQGKVAPYLDNAIKTLLQTHSKDLPNIAMVRFDPYNECKNRNGSEEEYGSIIYRVRPLNSSGNHGKTQLCPPTDYQEKHDDFSKCKLFKVVAWDHVSYPGNNYWKGSRKTDDGIAAAATDSMNAFVNEPGYYDANCKKFVMPDGNSNKWHTVAQPLATVTNNLMVVFSNREYVTENLTTQGTESSSGARYSAALCKQFNSASPPPKKFKF